MFGRHQEGKNNINVELKKESCAQEEEEGMGMWDLGEIQPNMIPSFPGNKKKLSLSIL